METTAPRFLLDYGHLRTQVRAGVGHSSQIPLRSLIKGRALHELGPSYAFFPSPFLCRAHPLLIVLPSLLKAPTWEPRVRVSSLTLFRRACLSVLCSSPHTPACFFLKRTIYIFVYICVYINLCKCLYDYKYTYFALKSPHVTTPPVTPVVLKLVL